MLDFLADAMRIHPLKPQDFAGLDFEEPMRHAVAWIRAWIEADPVQDDLGELLSVEALTNSGLGQVLTPRDLADLMVRLVQVDAAGPPTVDEPHQPPPDATPPAPEAPTPAETTPRGASDDPPLPRSMFDVACGTGRFLLEAMIRNAAIDEGGPYVGIDIDLRMVRASILNLVLANLWRLHHGHPPATFRILWGNALAPSGENPRLWAHANEWNPPHWSSFETAPPQRRASRPSKGTRGKPRRTRPPPTPTAEQDATADPSG